MKSLIGWGVKPVDSHVNEKNDQKWSLLRKLMLGLTPGQYLGQALRNPFNWILGIIFAIGLPLIAYNIPGRTASNILPATFARLAAIEQVVGVKEACGDLCQISEMIARCPDDFAVLSGDDALTLPMLAIGGRGVISTSSNVAPVEMVRLVRAFREGDVEAARACHYRLLPLFDALFCETNPIPVKCALHIMGLCGPEIRLPLTPLTDPNRDRLQVVLKELELA